MKNLGNKQLTGWGSAAAAALALVSALPSVQAQVYTATDLGTLGGGIGAYPAAINSSGTIVGKAFEGSDFVAFSFSNGTMASLGTLGGADSTALAVNNSGTIVGGSYTTGDTVYSAFIYGSGTMTLLSVGVGNNAEAYAINSSGVIAGWGAVGGTQVQAFIYSSGSATFLGTLGGTSSEGTGINDSGTVIGWSYTTSNAAMHAFSYSSGTMTDLGTLGGGTSLPGGINNSGMIVGYAQITGNAAYHAFSYSNGTMSDLGTLGGSSSYAYGVNSSGLIVGSSGTTGGAGDAFIYVSGQMTDLNSLVSGLPSGVTLAQATAINDQGMIVAYGSDDHAYLLTPLYYYSATALVTLAGGSYPLASAINDSGVIVGQVYLNSNWTAFGYSNGSMTNLGTLGGIASYAYAINNAGEIVGGSNPASSNSGDHPFSTSITGPMTDLGDSLVSSGGTYYGDAYGINRFFRISCGFEG